MLILNTLTPVQISMKLDLMNQTKKKKNTFVIPRSQTLNDSCTDNKF